MSTIHTFSAESLARVDTPEAAARACLGRGEDVSGMVAVKRTAVGWSVSLYPDGNDEDFGEPVQKIQVSTRGKVRPGKRKKKS